MIYDTLILGGGPAGYTAGIYAVRYNLKCLVIAKEPGGVMNEASKVENYPGIYSLSGIELMNKIKEHVEYLGVGINQEEVVDINKSKKGFKVKTNKKEYEAKTLILTLGAERRKLGVPGERELNKRGVSYCYTCDGAFYRKKKVIIVGGGDAAAQAVLLLASGDNEVIMLYRSKIRAEPIYQDRIKSLRNVKLIKGEIARINGKDKVESVTLKSGKDVKVDGVFIEIGSEPDLSLFRNFDFELENGYIKVDKYMRTNIKGIFAAGDVTNTIFRQAITAAANASIAVHSVYTYLNK